MATTEPKTTLEVYTVIESRREGDRNYWHRVGSAWKNRDGSLSIKLNSLPMNGELIVKKPRPRDDSDGDGGSSSGNRRR